MILTETQEKIQNTTEISSLSETFGSGQSSLESGSTALETGIGEWQEKLDRKILVQKKCKTNPAFSECAEVIQAKSFEKSR